MVFSSIEFLFVFLPAALALYALSPRPLRNTVLMLASFFFYAWGGGSFVFLLLASVGLNFVLGMLAGREGLGEGLRKACVAAAVGVNLGILGTFKYGHFAIAQWDQLSATFGAPPVAWAGLALPIGISFYTFQAMSYVFDVARGRAAPVRNPVDFALYVVMFPQIIAGPIVRFHEIAAQISERHTRVEDFSAGAVRFCFGLAKKVIIADSVGAIADAVFNAGAQPLPTGAAWLGLLAYTLQIYFDFSGYSDMAIGLGRLFGFRLPENFDRPYSALSVTDFWRRWHITLSNWFRDYLFIPLGGSRGSAWSTYRNLLVVFLLCGFWHGAAWTFIAWGAYHGFLLVAERVTARRFISDAPHPILQRAGTLLLVMLGWVVFRSNGLDHAGHIYASLVGLGQGEVPIALLEALTYKNIVILLLGCGVLVLPGHFNLGVLLERGEGRALDLARAALLVVVVPYLTLLVMSGTYSPFLYFQF